MKILDPLILKEKYYARIEKEINRLLYDVLFKKLLAAIPPKLLKNSADNALIDAIEEGTVFYENGIFKGAFNSRISKELIRLGARYNARSKGWVFSGALPPELSIANAKATAQFEAIYKDIYRTLADVDVDSISRLSKIPDAYHQTIEWMEGDFLKTVKAISIPPQLTQDQIGTLTADWSYNMDLYVKKWTDEAIISMREKVQKHVYSGGRSKALAEIIRQQYGVSKHKARFLARQETSLLLSKFHATRCKDVGCFEYIWHTSNDERVRDDHKILNNKVFRFDDPPVVDRRTGARANAGEYFGCRCTARPLIK